MDQFIVSYKNKVISLVEQKSLGYLSEEEASHALCEFVNNILDTLDENERIIAMGEIFRYHRNVKDLIAQLQRT